MMKWDLDGVISMNILLEHLNCEKKQRPVFHSQDESLKPLSVTFFPRSEDVGAPTVLSKTLAYFVLDAVQLRDDGAS